MSRTALKNAKSQTAGAASSKFAAALTHRQTYRIATDFDIWYKFDATGGSIAAAAEDGAVFLAGGAEVEDTPLDGAKLFLHVLRASTVDAKVNLAEVDEV